MLEEDIRNSLIVSRPLMDNRPLSVKDVLKFKNELKKEILNLISEKDLSVSSSIELLNELANDLIYSNDQKLKYFLEKEPNWWI